MWAVMMFRILAALAIVGLGCGKGSREQKTPPPVTAARARDASAGTTTDEVSPIPGQSSQLVLGISRSWTATEVRLQRYERGGPEADWSAVGEPIPAILGHAGMGWGLGLHGAHAPAGLAGPIKVEGDGRSPAGLFSLGAAFGYAPEPPAGTAIDYVQVNRRWRCVDDPESSRYNAVFSIDELEGERDWKSAEAMRRSDELYRWGVLVDHNAIDLGPKRTRPARASAGSCIFLHVWRAPDSPTVGCAAMERSALEELIAWLRPHQQPIIALLPEPQYDKLARRWRLP